MSQSPDISIVIVNYNAYDYTAQCLASIFEHPPQVSFEIVVVDNASADDSAGRLERDFPQIELVRSPENRGIAGGNNLGIRSGTGRFVLLLNNDTIVLPGVLDRVSKFLDARPDVGGVGGNLLNADKTFQSGACSFPTLAEELLNVTKLGLLIRDCYPSLPPFKEEREVDWMSTAFMLFRRVALENIGLVDERFFIYSDETDLEYRLWKAGWKIYYLPDVNTIHFGGKSLQPWRSRRLKYRGRLLFFEKHRVRLQVIALRALFVMASFVKLVYWTPMAFVPSLRPRALNEIKSQIEIFKLSLAPLQ
jgi:hypothetical protein